MREEQQDQITGTGRPGIGDSAISAIRARSQMIITRRYGYRSASAASTGPPTIQGR